MNIQTLPVVGYTEVVYNICEWHLSMILSTLWHSKAVIPKLDLIFKRLWYRLATDPARPETRYHSRQIREKVFFPDETSLKIHIKL